MTTPLSLPLPPFAAGEPQTPLVVKHGADMDNFHEHTGDSAQNRPPLCKRETPPRVAMRR
jgi:hypothetical protein